MTPPRPCVLLVDDNEALLQSMQFTLDLGGFDVVTAGDGEEALQQLAATAVDLIVADIAMPRLNGYQLYERVRENARWLGIPFIFLTARNLDSDVRFGKELGVDDYLTKPIEPEDLLASVRGKLRRAAQLRLTAHPPATVRTAIAQNRIVVGDLRLDLGQHRVWYADAPVTLSAREFTVLEYLAQRAESVVSPQAIVRVTHDLETDAVEASNLLRPVIRALRRKLGFPTGDMGCIETIRGVGYRLLAMPANLPLPRSSP